MIKITTPTIIIFEKYSEVDYVLEHNDLLFSLYSKEDIIENLKEGICRKGQHCLRIGGQNDYGTGSIVFYQQHFDKMKNIIKASSLMKPKFIEVEGD